MAAGNFILIVFILFILCWGSSSSSSGSSDRKEAEFGRPCSSSSGNSTGLVAFGLEQQQQQDEHLVGLVGTARRRRRLGLFRECAPCKCCTDSTRRFCYYTACCYKIDCFTPGLPFGHCSFTPVTCNCFRC